MIAYIILLDGPRQDYETCELKWWIMNIYRIFIYLFIFVPSPAKAESIVIVKLSAGPE